jgi:hypothetical protein
MLRTRGSRRDATESRLRSGAARTGRICAVLLFSAACRGDDGAIDRQVFVDTYVDLRTTALANPGGQIRPEQRDSVLARHSVTEDDLIHFTDVHGRNVEYMAEVWSEVENRLMPPPPETPPPASP